MIRLSNLTLDSIRIHGEEAYPHECCGVLLGSISGDTWTVRQAVRAQNASGAASRQRYSIAPLELVRVHRLARAAGLEIAGFYHSHPDHPPRWSATDLAEAHWLECCYLITEVHQGKAGPTAAFLLAGTREENKHFEPLPMEIID